MDKKTKIIVWGLVGVAIILVCVGFIGMNKSYTVKFNTYGGTKLETIKTKSGYVVTPINPVRKGYVFTGWYLGDKKFDFKEKIDKDVVLEAHWEIEVKEEEKNTYKVIFDSAGGSIIVAQDIEKETLLVKPENPTKEGYEFVGWYLEGILYDFGTVVSNDMTLIAKWDEVITTTTKAIVYYTVTYDSAGGTAIVTEEVESGKTITEPSAPTKNGYVFLGWYLNDKKYNFTTKVTASLTLVAKWQLIDEFNLNIALNSLDNFILTSASQSLSKNVSNGCSVSLSTSTGPSPLTRGLTDTTLSSQITANVTCGSKSGSKKLNMVVQKSTYTYAYTKLQDEEATNYTITISGLTNYNLYDLDGNQLGTSTGNSVILSASSYVSEGANLMIALTSDLNTKYVVKNKQ